MNNKNNRKSERKNLIYYLPVIDRVTLQPIGNLVNLTQEGTMLVSQNKFEPGTIYKARITPSDDIPDLAPLDLDMKCLWTEQDTNPVLWAAGFEILTITEATFTAINQLIEEFCFSGK